MSMPIAFTTAVRALRVGSLAALALLAACDNDPTPGTLLASETIQTFEYSAGLPLVPLLGVDATRLRYRSTDRNRDPVTVTAALLVPRSEWRGAGERPLVSFAIGTHGVGDGCGPSYALTTGRNYESPIIQTLLLLGYAVVATDYLGVGTDEPSTYVNRLDQGQAMLDAVRAAQQSGAASVPANGPVLLYGYSQGGTAAAAAAELQPTYAPEMNLIGAFAGSIPSDLLATIERIEFSVATGLLGNAINGLDAAFPGNGLRASLSDAGRAFVDDTAQRCVPETLLVHPLVISSSLFADGRPLSEQLRDARWQRPLADQQIGNLRPRAPVLILQSIADDVVPTISTRTVAERWCAQGATVTYQTLVTPGHIPSGAAAAPIATLWLSQRVAGLPVDGNCEQLGSN